MCRWRVLLPEGIVPDGKGLSEVGHAALKDRHELIAGDMLGHVAVQVVAATLGMAHLAQDAAVGAPSMASAEPLGLTERSMLGLPSSPTYCVATWPLAISWVSTSSLATKRPSPWLMATV